jgi:hypothetical protein
MLYFYTLKMEARVSSVTFIYRHQYRIHISTCQESVISVAADLFTSNLTWCPFVSLLESWDLNVLLCEVMAELWQTFMRGEEYEMGWSSCMRDTFPVLLGRTKEY